MVDNLRMRQAKRLQTRLVDRFSLVELHDLLPCSPGASLDQFLDSDSKTESRSRLAAKDAQTLKSVAPAFCTRSSPCPSTSSANSSPITLLMPAHQLRRLFDCRLDKE